MLSNRKTHKYIVKCMLIANKISQHKCSTNSGRSKPLRLTYIDSRLNLLLQKITYIRR